MHSYDTSNGRPYHRNGDGSGDVHVTLTRDELEEVPTPSSGTVYSAHLPAEDILEIAADLRSERAHLPHAGMVLVRIPAPHWNQIVIDIEDMCGRGAEDIEILSACEVYPE